MRLNEALSSAKDMFTIPDEVMGNIQKAFDSIQEKAYVHMEDISQLQEYFPRIIEYILKLGLKMQKIYMDYKQSQVKNLLLYLSHLLCPSAFQPLRQTLQL